MANQDNDFRLLMRLVADGDEDAAGQLVAEYGTSIRSAVRRVLNAKLRSKFDSLDFAQLVWCSVFRARDRLDRFERPGDLVAFLVALARNKVGLEVRRRLHTVKYDINRERESIDNSPKKEAKIPNADPAVIDVAIAREKLESILSNQPPRLRQIIHLRLQGKTQEEIARSLHVTRGKVYRFLKKLFWEHR